MTLALKRLKVYVRSTLIVVVAVAIALVLFKNRDNEVSFWFFGIADESRPLNVIWLMLCTAVGTLVSWWVFSFAWGLFRDMREVKRQQAVEELTETEFFEQLQESARKLREERNLKKKQQADQDQEQ